MRHSDTRRQRELGASRMKTFIWLVILISCVYTGVKVIPVLINEYEFQDAMQSTARLATVTRQTPEDIRKILFEEARRQEIPIQPEDIRVTSQNGNVAIETQYSITVDLMVYQWTLRFHPSARNNAL